MALYWDLITDRIGEVEMADGTILNLYSGNALAICVREEIGHYYIAWFWCDEAHMKNMLGLTKGYDNCMAHWGITRISLSLAYKKTPVIVQALAKANMEVLIDLYTPV